MRKNIIIAVLAVALVVPAGAATGASSKLTKITRDVKRALSISRDNRHDVTAFGKELSDHKNAEGEEIANVRRFAQEINGRLRILPDTFNDNATHEHSTSTVTIAAGTEGTASAACADGEAVVSGGYKLVYNGTAPQPTVTGERAVGSSWVVDVQNLDGSGSVEVDAFANCIAR